MRSVVEPLEPRTLFAAWPVAPFQAANLTSTIWVNQYGRANVSGRISSPGQFRGYRITFDDGGPLAIHVSGSKPLQIAFYTRGKPRLFGNSVIHTTLPDNKQFYSIGIRAANGRSTGAFRLTISGPRYSLVERMPVSSDAASSGSDISGTNDSDMYSFTTSQSGNWMVRTIPDNRSLDATINVFDSSGQPVGGTFTRPIDKRGPGGVEALILRGVKAHTTYYIRVDGKGSSIGGYGVAAYKV